MTRIENINKTIEVLQEEIHRLKSEITKETIQLNKSENTITSFLKENEIEEIENIIEILDNTIFDLQEIK